MKYRADIDGLRAVAILPVVLYHAGVPQVPGGFVGVDVFFVISGYLITGFILSDLDAGRFSLGHFYERRVRRIFPALAAMLLASTIAALLVLPARDLVPFARSAFAATVFFSNVLFARESGYFAAPADSLPLLHTWSLGIEEQFYLVFPALLLALGRAGPRIAVGVLALACAASFAWCVRELGVDPVRAFYLAPGRAWELGLGVLIALNRGAPLHRRSVRELAALAGIGLIALGVFGLDRHASYPGSNALYACAGTALLIASGGAGGTAVGALLASRPLVWLGLISYSLYLWHWPILVLLRHALDRPLDGSETMRAVVLSVVVALVSWRYIERPFRRRVTETPRVRPALLGAVAVMTASAAFALAAHHWNGWPERLGEDSAPIRGRQDYAAGTCLLHLTQVASDWAGPERCLVDHNNPSRTVLIWGDSFAAHYVPGLRTSPAAQRFNYLQYTAKDCPPVSRPTIPWRPQCGDINASIDHVLGSTPIAAVVLSARWDKYWNAHMTTASLRAVLDSLRARGIPVVLVAQGPTFDFEDPRDYVRRRGRDDAAPRDRSAINRELRSLVPPESWFDPNPALCPGGACPIRDAQGYWYIDGGHLSSYGSTLVAGDLAAAIERVLPPDDPR